MTSFALFQPFVGILPLISGSGKSCLSRAERMFTKHVFNDSDLDDLVPVSLRGALNPSLRLHRETKTVYTVHPSPNARVAVISGGGAGHESAHAGYTGNGMLTASVSGEIFASPSASQILTAIRLAVHSMKKPMDQSAVLLIVSNYTGDRLNFGLAAERARVLGIAVDIVVGAEDVSLLAWSAHPDSTERYEEPRAGPRGLAVNILVCKILGAAAANGSTLQELMSLGDAVTASLKSVGVGLAHCHVPRRSGDRNAGESQDADKLGKDECEIGMGLNNEPGARREVIGSAEYLGKRMVKMVIDALPREISADERYRDNDSADGLMNVHHQVGNVVFRYSVFRRMSQERRPVRFIRLLSIPRVISSFLFPFLFMTSSTHGLTQRLHIARRRALHQQSGRNVHPPNRRYRRSHNTTARFVTYPSSPRIHGTIHDIPQHAGLLHLPPRPRPHKIPRSPGLRGRTELIGYADRCDSRDEGRKWRDIGAEVDKIVETFGDVKTMKTSTMTHEEVLEKWRQVGVEPRKVDNAVKEACKSVFEVERDLTHFDTVAGDGDCGETFAARVRIGLCNSSRCESDGPRRTIRCGFGSRDIHWEMS